MMWFQSYRGPPWSDLLNSSHPDTELDLVALAKGFALPHLPRMPELKRADTSDFVPHSTPPSLIPFKNKAREKARQAKLAREGESQPVLSSDLLSITFCIFFFQLKLARRTRSQHWLV